MGERILVVDDEEIMRKVIADTLHMESVGNVTTATNVDEAISAIESSENFDLIITDIVMPGGTGVELLRWCKGKHPNLPVILMTGYADIEAITDALNFGAFSLLRKPFKRHDLVGAVETALAKERLRKQKEDTHSRITREINILRQQLVDEIMEKENLFMATLLSLAKAIDARDNYTHQHSTNVAKYAKSITKVLGLPQEQQTDSYNAGLLHDIGKISIPESILLKPGKLDDNEFTVIKSHSIIGAEILAPLPDMKNVIDAVRAHHERHDGRGYPDGLEGGDIPTLAKVICVCDSFDAMTTDRPYHKGFSLEKATAVLLEEKGRQFDPDVVDAFVDGNCAHATSRESERLYR